MDKEILARLKQGSYKAFDEIYTTYSKNLYAFVFSLTRSHDKAAEILQETFIKVWESRVDIDPERPFKSWLFTVAKNKIIDEFRRTLGSPLFESYLDYCEDIALSEIPEVERKLDFDVFKEELKAAKKKLSPRQLQIFEMRKEEGLSSSEIAARLGLSEQTVYNVLSSALKILKSGGSGLFLALFVLFFE